MRYARFNTYEDAFSQLEFFNNLAKSETSSFFNLTKIFEINNFFWFNFDDCVNHGGLAREEIETNSSILDIFEFENLE